MKKTFLFICTIIFINTAFAQSNGIKNTSPFVLGVIDEIHSNELNENRHLNIYLPEGYSPDSATTYPVIYLLDGSANEDFIHIVGVVQFLTMIEAMPKSIVMGIANVDRRRDFTFPTTITEDKKNYPTTGSSEKFISFIEKELEPYIAKKYKTNNVKTIIGQSLGGLLATEILLKKSYLFDNYLIVSPSLWWDNESLLNAAPQLLQKQDNKNKHVFISAGSEGDQMINDAKHLAEFLKASGKNNLQTEFIYMPEENHLTILHNSVYKTLELLYKKDNAKKE